MNDWNWDRKKVYGMWGWRRRRRLNLGEHLFASPVADAAIVLYHLAEIGLDSQVGHLVVLKEKQNPRVVWRDGHTTYDYVGEDSVHWIVPRGWGLLYQCMITRDGIAPAQRRYEFQLMVLDLERERMARWERVLDRRFPIRMDGNRAILDESGQVAQGPLICDVDQLSWRPFGHWQR
jgi:hypothetical protein